MSELIAYDPERGVFHWRQARGRAKAGDRAGNVRPDDGRLVIKVDGTNVYAYRIAWAITHGEWPVDVIDHINGDHTDNRLINLRSVAQSANCQNKKRPQSTNTSGFRGVNYHRDVQRWRATIGVRGKNVHLGWFSSAKAAAAAYEAARREMHPSWVA